MDGILNDWFVKNWNNSCCGRGCRDRKISPVFGCISIGTLNKAITQLLNYMLNEMSRTLHSLFKDEMFLERIDKTGT